MLDVTDAAIIQFKNLLSDANAQGSGIRVFVSGSGCCSSYGLDISANGEPGDELIERDGLKVFVEPRAYDELSSAKIDYVDSGDIKGFTITGLSSSCCG